MTDVKIAPSTVGDNDQILLGQPMSAPWSDGDAAPSSGAPLGACDCHIHIFDARFPWEGAVDLQPATVLDYRLFMRRLGLSRAVVVQPSPYGTDNRCLVNALGEFGSAVARGVAIVDPEITDAELANLHESGVRAMRIYLAKNRVPTADEMRSMGRRAAVLGWSLQLVGNREVEVFLPWEKILSELPCHVIIDHFGWTPQPAGAESETAKMMFRLLKSGQTYVKLSGLYLSSVVGYPGYRDLDDLAKRLVEAAPDRLIWGTDWPHAVSRPKLPDGAMLFDRLAEWAPDPEIRRKILVDNPTQLFWSDSIPSTERSQLATEVSHG